MDFVDPNGPSLEQTTVQTLVTGIQAGIRINNEFYLRDVAVIGREAYYLEPADAQTDLENAGSSFGFTLSDGFADFSTPQEFIKFSRGLKARVEIYRKNYIEALTALSESFVDVAAPLTKGVYLDYGTGVGDQLNPIYEVPDASIIKLFAHPSFIADAEAGDTRVAAKTYHRSSATTLDASNALDEVLKQKRYSLFLEGFRWVDLRLYNKLDELPIDRTGDVVHVQMPVPSTESN